MCRPMPGGDALDIRFQLKQVETYMSQRAHLIMDI